jgi:hypothetical protein
MTTILYLLRSDNCPDFGPDTDALLIADEETQPSEVEIVDCACFTTLVANCDDSPDFRQAVTEWWEEFGGRAPILHVLATDPTLMSEDHRNSISELEPSSWGVRSHVVLFPRDSADAEAEARKIVVGAALSSQ